MGDGHDTCHMHPPNPGGRDGVVLGDGYDTSAGGVAEGMAGGGTSAFIAAWAHTDMGPHDWFSVTCTDAGTDPVLLHVVADDGPTHGAFDVTDACAAGSCVYTHYVAGVPAQLRPSRVFCELFLLGNTDPDLEYIFRGAIFGFRVINPDCSLDDHSKHRSVHDDAGRVTTDEKLRTEISRGCISFVDDRPSCVHDLFCVPKENGRGKAIVDCSKPLGRSVNNHTDQVCVKFKYRSVDTVADLMETGDYMCMVDINDTYHAVFIRR